MNPIKLLGWTLFFIPVLILNVLVFFNYEHLDNAEPTAIHAVATILGCILGAVLVWLGVFLPSERSLFDQD